MKCLILWISREPSNKDSEIVRFDITIATSKDAISITFWLYLAQTQRAFIHGGRQISQGEC